MGREVDCSYGLDSPVEADFAPILKEDNSIHILVALDYKRLVLFVSMESYSYEIWVDYVCRKTGYLFYERLYTLRCHYFNDEREHF